MRISICLVALSACGAPTKLAPNNERHAVSPAARPCPPEVEQRLRADDERPMELIGCVSGKFPKPGWAAAYRFQGAEGSVRLAINDGARIATGEVSAMSFAPMVTADLDGDGVDELVSTTAVSALFGDESHDVRRIVAFALRGDEVKEVGDALVFGTIKPYGSLETTYECAGQHALERDPGGGMRLIVTVAPVVGHRDDRTCPSAGRHIYRVAGDKLVEVVAK